MLDQTITSVHTVERTIWIAAPTERAWRAVTEPQQMEHWYAKNFTWEIPTLQVGATMKFHNNPADILTATIEVLDPPHQFTLRRHSQPELVTTFLLTEENDGTRATITETGYDAVPAAERQQWIDSTASGYTMSMVNLQAHLEGRELPY